MSFSDRFLGGVRTYLFERGFKFAPHEHIIDVYEEGDATHCIIFDRVKQDYRNITVNDNLAQIVAIGRIGTRM